MAGSSAAGKDVGPLLDERVQAALAALDLPAVEAWLDGKGHVDARHAEHRGTMLMDASIKGHEQLVELLLGRGASPDLQDHMGLTALMGAAVQGHVGIAKRLLAAGARTDLKDQLDATAMDYTGFTGQTAVAQLLREQRQAPGPVLFDR